ncbi:MAG TPA: hypothetical protein DCQ28_13115 [Bacteroidetes bacterium]|nr:hypothetical protein [Bacteroidota bacterium]
MYIHARVRILNGKLCVKIPNKCIISKKLVKSFFKLILDSSNHIEYFYEVNKPFDIINPSTFHNTGAIQ